MIPPTPFETLMAERYSCRAFLPDPVPEPLIERLFASAQQTASWCNTQPWQVHLLSGDAVARFGAELTEHVQNSEQHADLDLPTYTGVHAERRRESGYALYSALDIERSDYPARAAQMLQNFTFFGAPHTAVITSDRALGSYGVVDCGGYVSTLMLAAQSLGLAAIAQAAIALYADFVRDWLDLPEDRLVICAVSFGYADPDHPANRFRTSRAPLSAVVHRIDS